MDNSNRNNPNPNKPPPPPNLRRHSKRKLVGRQSSDPVPEATLTRDDAHVFNIAASGKIYEKARSRHARQREALLKHNRDDAVPLSSTNNNRREEGRRVEGRVSQLPHCSEQHKEEDEEALKAAAAVFPAKLHYLGRARRALSGSGSNKGRRGSGRAEGASPVGKKAIVSVSCSSHPNPRPFSASAGLEPRRPSLTRSTSHSSSNHNHNNETINVPLHTSSSGDNVVRKRPSLVSSPLAVRSDNKHKRLKKEEH